MEVGRRIYYLLATGNVLKDTGDRQGLVFETTEDEDFVDFTEIQGIDRSTVGVLRLNYGDYATQYQTSYASHVDQNTMTITFTPCPTST